MRTWLRNFGFPALVLAGLGGAGYLAASVPVPDPVPAFALQAAAVYRLEVGAACFVVVYLAAMAFFLALDGRGFAELGTRGLRATEVVRTTGGQQGTLSKHMLFIRNMEKNLEDLESALGKAIKDLRAQEQRLQQVEKRSG